MAKWIKLAGVYVNLDNVLMVRPKTPGNDFVVMSISGEQIAQPGLVTQKDEAAMIEVIEQLVAGPTPAEAQSEDPNKLCP